MIESVKPMGRRLIVEIPKVEEKTKAGIILPGEHVKENQFAQAEGVVVSIGGDAFTPDMVSGLFQSLSDKPKPGDRVTFRSYAGSTFGIGDKMYRTLKDEDILMLMGADVKLKSI